MRRANFAGKVALVTGGSRGLGFLLARELARNGCKVAICARKPEELERARRKLEQDGAEVLTVTCDVADRDQVHRLVDETVAHFRQIDILVNNAGIIQVAPVQDTTIQDFEEAMDVMFWGVLYPTMAVRPGMLARRSGWIVNITSIGGKISAPHLLPYDSAKFAAVGLSEGLRAELSSQGISVTTVVPGLMRTGSHLNAHFGGRQEAEFTWFSMGASLPLVSMDAERAARQIVAAARGGEAEIVLTPWANLAARLYNLSPAASAHALSLVNRLLPSLGVAGTARATGHEVRARLGSQLLETATSLGRSAARRFNQYPDDETN